ncbi:hypothetical protein J7L48_10505, partial [bacterium]|nr:hypothetical protein [bacterium]
MKKVIILLLFFVLFFSFGYTKNLNFELSNNHYFLNDITTMYYGQLENEIGDIIKSKNINGFTDYSYKIQVKNRFSGNYDFKIRKNLYLKTEIISNFYNKSYGISYEDNNKWYSMYSNEKTYLLLLKLLIKYKLIIDQNSSFSVGFIYNIRYFDDDKKTYFDTPMDSNFYFASNIYLNIVAFKKLEFKIYENQYYFFYKLNKNLKIGIFSYIP